MARQRALAVIAASNSLTRLLAADPAAVGALIDPSTREPLAASDAQELQAWKRRELLRIAVLDLCGDEPLEAVAAALSDLADDVVRTATSLAGLEECIAVIALGKLGAQELNYASDIDVVFVGDAPTNTLQELLRTARGCFRVDVNLRPEGRDGALVRTLEGFRAYWQRWAEPWELQALLKARACAGDPDLGAEWEAAAANTVWSASFDADAIRSLRDMKARGEQLLHDQGLANREIKRGRGGIRDIEFSVQLLQLVHGGADLALRERATLPALRQLAIGGYIRLDDADALASSYRFLRTVEHRLQLVDEEQTHTVPEAQAELERLAASLHYRSDQDRTAAEAFREDLRGHQRLTREAHERLYFRPLLEAFGRSRAAPSTALVHQLAAFGFIEAERTRDAVVELTRGIGRRSRLMDQYLPLLLEWLSASPDPDLGLLGLRKLVQSHRNSNELIGIFRDSPETARRLCVLLGTSPLFAEGFLRNPDLLSELDDLSLAARGTVADRLRAGTSWRHDASDRRRALLRSNREHLVRIAAADVLGTMDGAASATARTELAEATLQLALEDIDPQVEMAIVAVGRFGGMELAYGSDLDVIAVHADAPGASNEAERVVRALRDRVADSSPVRHLYALDFDLRPGGRSSALVHSLAHCREYYAQWASTWERQALIRARPIAGSTAVADALMATLQEFVWSRPLVPGELREVRRLKARMEVERIPRGEDPEFHLKLGTGSLSDVEWTVQLLQLQHHVPETRTIPALQRLVELGHVQETDAADLRSSWQFCDMARNRWYLINGQPSDALPANVRKLSFLARSLGEPEIRERYRAVTRRARSVVERLFYGRTQA